MLKITALTGLALAALTGGAFAADLVQPGSAEAPAASSEWGGFYAGLNIGYGPGTLYSGDWEIGDEPSLDFSGLFVGGQAGYNFALDNGLVLGVQGDVEWANETGSTSGDNGYYTANFRVNWTGALTGRIGYAGWGNILPYALGGVAFANGTLDDYYDYGAAQTGSSTATSIGLTAGAGLEASFTPTISGFAEARFTDYGAAVFGDGNTNNDADAGALTMSDTTVRTGLNFHF